MTRNHKKSLILVDFINNDEKENMNYVEFAYFDDIEKKLDQNLIKDFYIVKSGGNENDDM